MPFMFGNLIEKINIRLKLKISLIMGTLISDSSTQKSVSCSVSADGFYHEYNFTNTMMFVTNETGLT